MISTLHYISQGKTPDEHLENIEKACWFGVDWVQLRLKGVSEQCVLDTANEAVAITNDFSARLIINDYYEIAKEVFAYGVHLGKSDTCPLLAREHLYENQIIGGTANTLTDCTSLIEKNVDYIGLGPLRETTTKKTLSPILGELGYELVLEEIKKISEIPIIAIGGVRAADIPILLSYGVHGVAVSGTITRDFNTIETFIELLRIAK